MTAFTLKIGTVDLSQYVRVAPSDGLDVYGSGWEEPQFNATPGGEGQAYVSTDVKNREMVWPLYLKGVDKDTLAALRQQVVREVRYGARPLRVEWADNGSSASTFYDVAFARLDEKQNYRLNDHDYADATLHVWCQPPWGHTATQRIVGTAAASGVPAVVVPLASVAGDIEPLGEIIVSTGSWQYSAATSVMPMRTIVSLLPGGATGYDQTIASIAILGGASLIGASGAIGSQVMRAKVTSSDMTWRFAASGVDRARVLALARQPSAALPFRLDLTGYGRASPIQTWASPISAGAWMLVDLGVLDTSQQRLAGETAFDTFSITVSLATMGMATGATGIDYNRFWVLPEDSTMILTEDTKYLGVASLGDNASYLLSDARGRYTRQNVAAYLAPQAAADVAARMVGRLPRLIPGQASQAIMMIHLQEGKTPPGQTVAGQVAVRERFTFHR